MYDFLYGLVIGYVLSNVLDIKYIIAYTLSIIYYIPTNNTTITKIGKNVSKLSYMIKDNIYNIFIQTRKGPRKVQCIKMESGNDVTELVQPFLGPAEDCHGMSITPIQIGISEPIYIYLYDGRLITIAENDTINIS